MLGIRLNPVYPASEHFVKLAQIESSNLSDIFELDLLEGTITSKLTKSRGFVFAANAWAQIRDDIEAVYLSGGPTILERMGFTFGKSLVKTEQRSNTEQAVLFENLADLAGSTGWGKLTLSAGDPTSDQARFRIKNCVFCSEIRGRSRPVCEFMAGVIRGAADELFGGQHKVTEEVCAAMGDDACDFLLEKREAEASFGEALGLF
jgi:predicted hydrocarbon binding protein